MTVSARPAVRPYSRRQRRLLVLIVVAAALTSLLSLFLYVRTGQIDMGPPHMLTIFTSVSAWLTAFSLLYSRRAQLPDGADTDLDERQRQHRDAAYRQAYLPVMLAVCSGIIYFWMASIGPWPGLPDHPSAGLLPLQATIFLFSLPSLILAWTERDSADDPSGAEGAP